MIPLSEAIALGRTMLLPKAAFLSDGEGAGCALGMGLVAIGKKIEYPGALGEPRREWPWLMKKCKCPCSCDNDNVYKMSYAEAIAHLFDAHVMSVFPGPPNWNWTLDQLIDWVRSVEPKESKEKEDGHTSDALLAPVESEAK